MPPESVSTERGDLVLVRGYSWLSRLIRVFTRTVFEDKTRVNHVALVVKGGAITETELVEAIRRGITRTSLWGGYRGKEVVIYRATNVSQETLDRIAAHAASKIGLRYPIWRLAAHLLDWLLLDAFLFRRIFWSSKAMECSNVVAWAFGQEGLWFGKDSRMITPDHIDDFARERDFYEEIMPLGVLS